MGPVNFFAQVCCLIVLNPVMFSRADKPPDISPEQKSKPDQQQSFDFIIAGGGTSGCAIARRLSESGNFSVLLIEIGGYPQTGLDIPALTRSYLTSQIYSKVYTTVPQRNVALSRNGTINFTVGRTLGGTSEINGMVFNRGSPEDYNNWARITGDDSWKYSNLLRIFKKIENYAGDFPSDQHGVGGPITVSSPKFAPGLQESLEAGKFLGYPVGDPNGPQKVGFFPAELSQKRGRRVSSYTGYLKPIISSRPNLNVIVNAEVRRIIFEGNRAVGVIYRNTESGEEITARVNKEVIVTAGVINSPVILLRSGIGPKDDLTQAKIPLAKDLPVGKNLHDHVTVKLDFVVNNKTAVFIPERDLTLESFLNYQKFGDGPYTSYGGARGQAFISSSMAPNNKRDGTSGWPDIHLSFIHSPMSTGILQFAGLAQEGLLENEVPVACLIFLVRPKSRGTVALNATDIYADPIIDFQYLSHPDDTQVLLEAVNFTLNVYENTPSFQRQGARYPITPVKECNKLRFRSDAYWRCFIRSTGGTGLHGCGSNRLGARNDPSAVVDTKFKVIGIDNVRVADASVMPVVVNANTQAATYVIAEKASEEILKHWSTPPLNSAASRLAKLRKTLHVS